MPILSPSRSTLCFTLAPSGTSPGTRNGRRRLNRLMAYSRAFNPHLVFLLLTSAIVNLTLYQCVDGPGGPRMQYMAPLCYHCVSRMLPKYLLVLLPPRPRASVYPPSSGLHRRLMASATAHLVLYKRESKSINTTRRAALDYNLASSPNYEGPAGIMRFSIIANVVTVVALIASVQCATLLEVS